jgi:hypothetical protein
MHPDPGFGRQADEGITTETLPPYYRFQQVGIGTIGKLEINA